MAQIKINNIIYGSNNAADIIYRDITVEEKLDTIPIFDINDNSNIDNNNSNNLTYGHIVNALNSDAEDKVLSAKQGKVLKNSIDNIDFSPLENDILTLEESMESVNNQLQELNTFKNTFLNLVYPIGAIYLSLNSTNPASLFGGTWEQLKDKFLLGAGNNYNAGSTGGEATHTLTVNEMPVHEGHLTDNNTNTGGNYAGYLANTTTTAYGSSGRGWNVQMGNEIVPAGHNKGGGAAHNNMPPYLTVYMWKRVS